MSEAFDAPTSLDTLLAAPYATWALVGIVYLLAALLLRQWLLSPLMNRLQDLENDIKQRVKRLYLKRSISGWLFFFLPLGLWAALWYAKTSKLFFLSESNVVLISLGCLGYSIFLHVRALGIALARTLDEVSRASKSDPFAT